MCLNNKDNFCIQSNTIWEGTIFVDIIISSNTNKPIYEQISTQIKAMIMNGELKAGDAIPPMRAMAKSLRVSVITVQHAYEDLQREGFIETIIGRGSFIASYDIKKIRKENLKKIEKMIQEVVEVGKNNGIPIEKLHDLLNIYYGE